MKLIKSFDGVAFFLASNSKWQLGGSD